jgi:putative fibronectin type III domain protein
MKQDMAMGNKVSDWLISPMLSGDAQNISFWYKTLNNTNGTPSFEVAYSTTDSLYTSFTNVVVDTVISMRTAEWLKMTVSLPAGTRYFAIHHTTPINVNQMLMIDDIMYEKGNGTVIGYKIYRDGNYLTTVTSPTYTDTAAGGHEYNVTVITGKGESKFSNTASITTGINSVEGNTLNNNAATYNLAGQKVNDNYKGIIIRKGKKIIKK